MAKYSLNKNIVKYLYSLNRSMAKLINYIKYRCRYGTETKLLVKEKAHSFLDPTKT